MKYDIERELSSDSGIYVLGDGPSHINIEDDYLTILIGKRSRVLFASLDGRPISRPGSFFIGIGEKLRYQPLCADFGPFNLGTPHHVCNFLHKAFGHFQRPNKIKDLVFYTTKSPTDVANAVYILGAFLCLHLGATPDQAWLPFQHLGKNFFPPFRDATWVRSTFDLHLRDCWSGLCRAVTKGLYSVHSFDQVLQSVIMINCAAVLLFVTREVSWCSR